VARRSATAVSPTGVRRYQKRGTPKPPFTKPRDPDDLDELRASADDAGRLVRAAYLTVLSVGVYLAIAIGSTTDLMLVKDEDITLPIINVGLPVWGFYLVAPLLFSLLHLNLLVQLKLLAGKLWDLDRCIRAQKWSAHQEQTERRKIFSFLFSHYLIGRHRGGPESLLLAFIISMSVVILPIFVQLWALIRFLPYHDEAVTWFNRLAAVAMVGAVVVLWPQILGRRPRLRWLRRRFSNKRRRRRATVRARLASWRSTFQRGSVQKNIKWRPWFSADRYQHRKRRYFDRRRLAHRRLTRQKRNLRAVFGHQFRGSTTVIASCVFALPLLNAATFPDGTGDNINRWIARQISAFEVVRSEGRTAKLCSKSRRCWWLTYVLFDPRDSPFHRNLQLSEARIYAGSPKTEVVELATGDNAGKRAINRLKIATLNLRGRNLVFADFSDARLPNMDLRGARLQGANLRRVRLQGADLRLAQLQGANLRRARLQGANLWSARLHWADLRSAQLQGAFANTNTNLKSALLIRIGRGPLSPHLARAIARFISRDIAAARGFPRQTARNYPAQVRQDPPAFLKWLMHTHKRFLTIGRPAEVPVEAYFWPLPHEQLLIDQRAHHRHGTLKAAASNTEAKVSAWCDSGARQFFPAICRRGLNAEQSGRAVWRDALMKDVLKKLACDSSE